MPLPALRGSDLTVRFGSYEAVSHTDITLTEGTVTALVGPNGSGKSTLLRALSRLVRPDTGTVAVGDVEDTSLLSARDFATRVGLLAQQRITPSGLTVRDLVEFGRHPHRSGWRGRDPQGHGAVERALTLTGLADLQETPLETLSGGQLQRAWFAAALAQDTSVLLLDEPTNHLDLRYQVEVLELVHELASLHGVAVGVVLHDLNHAAEIADRVLVLSRGRVVADGPAHHALDADLLTDVYEIPVTVRCDDNGELEVRARRFRDRAIAF